MNHSTNRVFGIALSLIASAIIAQPSFAQLGGSPASGSIDQSGANQGQQNNTDNLQTAPQAVDQHVANQQNYVSSGQQHTYNQAPYTRGALEQTSTGSLAPNSVNMSPYPSGSFSYGFPSPGPQVFMYASKGGPGLPVTSTSSVDINTVDCNFIRLPGEYDNNPASGMGPPNLTETPPTQNNYLQNQNTSVQNALQNLDSFFGFPF
jgi:hypothetical protein